MYLVDTSAWIPALRGHGNGAAAAAVSAALDEDTAATCQVVMLELLSGVKSRKHYEELLADLKALHFIPISDRIWESSFKLGFELRRKGLAAPATDILIASAALDSGCTVMHCDKHFDLICRHSKLKVKKV